MCKDKVPNVKLRHCFLHRQAIAAKNLSDKLHDWLDPFIKCVNYTEARPLIPRFYLCVGAVRWALTTPHRTKVRWLSRGRVLKQGC